MLPKGQDVIDLLEELAPNSYAMEGDPVGLQWGNPELEVKGIIFALDFNKDVLQEAVAMEANFVITHHPYLFQPLTCLDLRRTEGNLLYRALQSQISLVSAHTNLDIAPLGVNHVLANLFALQKRSLLRETGKEKLLKLVVFVPEGHEDDVRDALSRAGAGWIGNYSHCTFQAKGTGTFLPREGTTPYLGDKGELNKVDELRLETILPARLEKQVLKSLFEAHPYEEVAYDIYPLQREADPFGLGMVGTLPGPVTLQEMALQVKSKLASSTLKVLGDLRGKVEKVAVLGGSGGNFIADALRNNVDVLITGDVSYHDAQQAERQGLSLIDAGHEATERPVVDFWAGLLEEKLRQKGFSSRVQASKSSAQNWQVV